MYVGKNVSIELERERAHRTSGIIISDAGPPGDPHIRLYTESLNGEGGRRLEGEGGGRRLEG